ncbi:ABC transporter substrate-binding protein [Laceyella putida]|uniref:ABC transporter substrate-binding protein n=1 Tax=Laceyella putida TaxID=110101 RepID=A0ABW2RL72_9BACL
MVRVKMILLSILMIVGSCLMTACNIPQNESAAHEKVTLTMWFWRGAGFEKIIPEFNKTHPHIEIKPQIIKWEDAHSKLFTALSAGAGAPDIAMIDISFVDTFLQYPNTFYNLNKLGAKSIQPQYLDWKWNQAVKGNHVMGLPTDTGPTVMYYRADLFKQQVYPINRKRWPSK